MAALSVEVANKAGACYGVNRALDMAYACSPSATSTTPMPVYTLGPLIHNPRVVAELAENGIGVVESLDLAAGGTIIIRSHGTSPQVINEAKDRGFNVVDATCPFVSKVHEHVRTLGEEGYKVIIIGEEGHAEVEGIRAWGGDAVIAVVDDPAALPLELPEHVGVVVQTTQSETCYRGVLAEIEKRCADVKAFKTICSATQQRQQAAAELAQRVDVMVVIGGRNSGNTKRLFEICSEHCPSFHIEAADELQSSWFEGATRVGVTAGASTPQEHINDVVSALKEL